MPSTQTDRLNGTTSGLAVKAPCRLKTTANHALSGLAAIDGVTPVSGDRILVGSQTDLSDNGIYKAASGAWTRAADFDGSYDAADGTLVFVRQGTAGAGRFYRVSATDPVVVGSSELSFADVGPTVTGDTLTFTPELYGAVGDGVTNDTDAFALMAAAFNGVGGGVIEFAPGATYLLGKQTLVNDGTWMFKPATICKLDGCTKPIVVRGNGAILKAAANLKFGTFNAAGAATSQTLPYLGGEQCGVTLGDEGLLTVNDCNVPVEISNLEINGNMAALNLGGQFGDTGRQCPGDGLFLLGVYGGLSLSNVYVHHCARDGLYLATAPADKRRMTITNLRSEYNGRNNASVGAGRGIDFQGCTFNHAGRGTWVSAPAAGVDLEAEFDDIRDVSFRQCEFMNNAGNGYISDSGDTADVYFEQCDFIGSTENAAWLAKPGIVAVKCRFIGGTRLYSTTDRSLGIKFKHCLFSDDTALSPQGTIGGLGGLLAGGSTLGAEFEDCTIDYSRTLKTFDFTFGIFRSCKITGILATSSAQGCIWEGDNVVTGVDPGFATGGSVFRGTFTYGGVRQRYATATYNPASLALGASDAIQTVTVPLARLGEAVRVTYSGDLAGATVKGWVSAANTVKFFVTNDAGANPLDLASGTWTAIITDNAA